MNRKTYFLSASHVTTVLLLFSVLSTFAGTRGSLDAKRDRDNRRPAVKPTKQKAAHAAGENVILQWNRVLQETIRTPGQHPGTIFPVRSFAMMHGAMFDAVNSIDRSYTPYLIDVGGAPRDSQEAAAAKAARDVLVALYPGRQQIFDEELAISLEGIPFSRIWRALIIGQATATRMLETRANDGWNATPPTYTLPPVPGNWQPAPPANAPAAFTHVPAVMPFALSSGHHFAPNPPPALTSAQYADDLNEVKAIGSATSSTRTAEQTQIAQLWANVNTPTTIFFVWNNVARSVAIARNNTTAQNARLFALLNMSFHDALQTTMTSKFVHGLWRPVTAIRRADEDGNAGTDPDPNWLPLLGNPPYPTYAGNHAAIGTSQSTILGLVFGRDDIQFQHTWDGAGGATRSYESFSEMANEEERSRVYGGIHFTFDQVAGQSAGRNVANYIFLNFMKPRCER